MELGNDIEIIRPAYGQLLAGALIVFATLTGVSFTASAGPAAVVTVWPWAVLVAGAAWVAYWRPTVTIGGPGVRLVNIFRTIDIPWGAVTDITSHWVLAIATSTGTFHAWGAPAPGRGGPRRAARNDRPLTVLPGVGNSPLPNEPSANLAAALLEEHWQRWEAAARPGSDSGSDAATPPEVHWHWRIMAVGLTVLMLGGIGLLF
jgi:hypothetical protein